MTTTHIFDLHALALTLCAIPGEADHGAAVDALVGQQAIFTTYEGDRRVGLVEAPISKAGGTGMYPIIRFDDGTWGRCDDRVEIVDNDNGIPPVDFDILRRFYGTCVHCRLVTFTRGEFWEHAEDEHPETITTTTTRKA